MLLYTLSTLTLVHGHVSINIIYYEYISFLLVIIYVYYNCDYIIESNRATKIDSIMSILPNTYTSYTHKIQANICYRFGDSCRRIIFQSNRLEWKNNNIKYPM